MELKNLREYAALGAGIGAGCPSCLEYHINEALRASLSHSEVLAALEVASKVKSNSQQELFLFGKSLLDASIAADEKCSLVDVNEAWKMIVAVGAAYGANNYHEMERHFDGLEKVGVKREYILEALEVSKSVQKLAGELSYKKLLRLIYDDDGCRNNSHGFSSCNGHHD